MKTTERRKTVVIAGASGFLGRTLSKYFIAQGDEVRTLSRHTPSKSSQSIHPSQQQQANARFKEFYWDGKTRGAWCEALDGADALINLAGRSVNCRYTKTNKAEIINSRIHSTQILGEALARCGAPPKVWLNSSTATIYANNFGQAHTETSTNFKAHPDAKDAFSIQVAQAWEQAFWATFEKHGLPWTKPLLLRTSLVFCTEVGGVWHTLRKLTKLGLGGTMGTGKQWVSWIHALDFSRAIDWLIESNNPAQQGIYNLCAPQPISNEQMMKTLRKNLGVKLGMPASKWMLELGAFFMRSETELILKSRNIVSERLNQEGFQFTYPKLSEAIASLSTSKESLLSLPLSNPLPLKSFHRRPL